MTDTTYTLVKSSTALNSNAAPVCRNERLATFKHYSTAMKALRATDSKHFVQGPKCAWWFDEVRAADMTRANFSIAKSEMALAWAN